MRIFPRWAKMRQDALPWRGVIQPAHCRIDAGRCWVASYFPRFEGAVDVFLNFYH